jgi:hypothetical protein
LLLLAELLDRYAWGYNHKWKVWSQFGPEYIQVPFGGLFVQEVPADDVLRRSIAFR